MIYKNISGVNNFECYEFTPKKNDYCLCIPVINEEEHIFKQLKRANRYEIDKKVDIIICDGGSHDKTNNKSLLKKYNVNTLLIKNGTGRQAAQLRVCFWWALQRGYKGIITIDGNNKDSIEDVPKFIYKLDKGYDFIQGSRFIQGGKAINTPLIRYLAVRLIHSPIISLTARYKFTDSTNAYRGYSAKYILDKRVNPFRNIFDSYELLAYLSVKASQLGMKVCEVPVTRRYPKGKIPTKISFFKGNIKLLIILFKNLRGDYNYEP